VGLNARVSAHTSLSQKTLSRLNVSNRVQIRRLAAGDSINATVYHSKSPKPPLKFDNMESTNNNQSPELQMVQRDI
jgi:hypothetical protein